ncbi:MAG TPA: transporter substrate-binding domain-containing protein [Smithellaceae bacterium]|nr:transporter substrate-binding domain-containing protein [Smithellaceae bacterium]
MPTNQNRISGQKSDLPVLRFLRWVFFLLLFLAIGIPYAWAENPVVKVGVYENAPKVFTNESGKSSGIFIDIIEYIAKSEGWKLEYVPGTWAEGLDRLERGEIDLMPDVALTAEREKKFSFHKIQVLSSWFQAYARKGSGLQSILDLNGKRIAILEQSVQEEAFIRFSRGFGLNVTLVSVPDYKTMFEMVARGDADAAVTNQFYGAMHARKYDLVDTAVVFEPSALFFAAPKNASPELLDAIDRHLSILKKDTRSAYYAILKRWTSEEVRFKFPAWLQIVFLIVGVVLLTSLAGSFVLKRQVNARTFELKKINREMEERIIDRTAELALAMEKAQAADRIKSAFLATMSHELRTPLNSIIGFTGILLQRLGGPLNEEQEKQLKMVYNSAKHLLNLINDVLDISKIEAGQLNVASETFNLRDAVEKVIKTSQPLADNKGLKLSAEIAPEIGTIRSDRRRVEQILLNLLSNAIKFTEQGYVRMTCEVRSDKIVIAVSDSGIGIKPEDLGILFNAFQQIESGITRKYDGTGLGLSICKQLANLLGGKIEVESEWGRGSTFSLILPLEGEKA